MLYRFMDMSEAMYELRLLAGNGYTQELTAYEKTRLVERTKAALIRAKEEDGLEIQGKMRDLVAAMINESSTNVARMDAINNNATPEIKEQLKEGNLGITAAYEAAKLDEDEQKEIAEKAAAGENVRAKEIAEKVAGWEIEGWELWNIISVEDGKNECRKCGCRWMERLPVRRSDHRRGRRECHKIGNQFVLWFEDMV